LAVEQEASEHVVSSGQERRTKQKGEARKDAEQASDSVIDGGDAILQAGLQRNGPIHSVLALEQAVDGKAAHATASVTNLHPVADAQSTKATDKAARKAAKREAKRVAKASARREATHIDETSQRSGDEASQLAQPTPVAG